MGMRSPQQAKSVVLLGSQFIPAKQLVFQLTEPVVRAPKVEKRLLLRRIEPLRPPPRFHESITHAYHYTSSNDTCCNNYMDQSSNFWSPALRNLLWVDFMSLMTYN